MSSSPKIQQAVPEMEQEEQRKQSRVGHPLTAGTSWWLPEQYANKEWGLQGGVGISARIVPHHQATPRWHPL
jgi:hypothetical protein